MPGCRTDNSFRQRREPGLRRWDYGTTLTLYYAAAPAPCEVYGVDPNLRTPYVSNWNLDIQRAITNNLSVDIGYVGNHGTKLLGKLNYQPATAGRWVGSGYQ